MHSILQWSNYFVAVSSAAAALTGFIFVGLSINLTRVLTYQYMPSRALQSLVFLLTILIVSTLGLVPDQPIQLFGEEVLFTGALSLGFSGVLQVRMFKNNEEKHLLRYVRRNIIFTALAGVPYLLAGIFIVLYGDAGIYWLVPAFVFSFIKALIDAWVLVIEISR